MSGSAGHRIFTPTLTSVEALYREGREEGPQPGRARCGDPQGGGVRPVRTRAWSPDELDMVGAGGLGPPVPGRSAAAPSSWAANARRYAWVESHEAADVLPSPAPTDRDVGVVAPALPSAQRGGRPPPRPPVLDSEAPPGEREVQSRHGDLGAARVDPGAAAAGARGHGPSGRLIATGSTPSGHRRLGVPAGKPAVSTGAVDIRRT
jgi:hypothetical protein